MPARRDKRSGRWRYRKKIRLPDDSPISISGTPDRNTKRAAEQAEREHIDRAVKDHYDGLNGVSKREEMKTLAEWFEGQYWRGWVESRKRKPSTKAAMRRHWENYIKPKLGELSLKAVAKPALVDEFRAYLVNDCENQRKPCELLGEKYINNILCTLSKTLKYAEEVEEIDRAPRVGLFKIEPREVECWELDQYSRLLAAAKADDEVWFAAVCLAGEEGMRIGEVKAVRWREDVDLVAGTVTINQQICDGLDGDLDTGEVRPVEGTPKGRTRRVVPLTETTLFALRHLSRIRTGYVVGNLDGSPFTTGQVDRAIHRICRRAGLPERGWHLLRHCFGTHAAMFGANPWTLMTWMGHKRIEETMGYVHYAKNHLRPLPTVILEAGNNEPDPDRRIIKMLSNRCNLVATTDLRNKKPAEIGGF